MGQVLTGVVAQGVVQVVMVWWGSWFGWSLERERERLGLLHYFLECRLPLKEVDVKHKYQERLNEIMIEIDDNEMRIVHGALGLLKDRILKVADEVYEMKKKKKWMGRHRR